MRYWQVVNLVLGRLQRFDASDYATRIAGEVKDFDITNYGVDKKEARRMDRSVEFAIGAAVPCL